MSFLRVAARSINAAPRFAVARAAAAPVQLRSFLTSLPRQSDHSEPIIQVRAWSAGGQCKVTTL